MTTTDDDIRSLRDEAGSAGDLEMARVCDRALDGSTRARRECEQVILDTRMRAAEDEDIAETRYQDASGWHRKHDVYGGPHDEAPQTGEQP